MHRKYIFNHWRFFWLILDAVFVIFCGISSKITKDKNLKSLINKITAVFLIFAFIFSVYFSVNYTFYLSSDWRKLESRFLYLEPVLYQDSMFRLEVHDSKKRNSTIYRIKLLVNDDGFYIKPLSQDARFRNDAGYLWFYRRLFIPWDAIEKCHKREAPPVEEIVMPIKESTLSIGFSHWGTLWPECKKKGIEVLE